MKLIRQLGFFGIVGCCAAVVQLCVVILLVEFTHMHPLVANIIGFLLAFNVSYFGHRSLTFAGTTVNHKVAVTRLFGLGVANFIANEGLFYIFLTVFKLYYPIALILVLAILPALTFVISKLWVFR